MTFDAVWEDIARNAQLIGRKKIGAMLTRSRDTLPFGSGARVRHVVGGAAGGGYEWIAGPALGGLSGISAVELDEHGLISRVTTTYDGRKLGRSDPPTPG